jgi:hypothetical protein
MGDLVLSTTKRNAKTRNKLSQVFFGPHRITKVDLESNKYELRSLVEHTTLEIHLPSLRPYKTEHLEPEAVAETDTMKHK